MSEDSTIFILNRFEFGTQSYLGVDFRFARKKSFSTAMLLVDTAGEKATVMSVCWLWSDDQSASLYIVEVQSDL